MHTPLSSADFSSWLVDSCTHTARAQNLECPLLCYQGLLLMLQAAIWLNRQRPGSGPWERSSLSAGVLINAQPQASAETKLSRSDTVPHQGPWWGWASPAHSGNCIIHTHSWLLSPLVSSPHPFPSAPQHFLLNNLSTLNSVSRDVLWGKLLKSNMYLTHYVLLLFIYFYELHIIFRHSGFSISFS